VLGLRLFLATTAIHSCHNTPRNALLVQPSPELKGQERWVPQSEPSGIRQRVPAVDQMVFYHLLPLLALLAVFQSFHIMHPTCISSCKIGTCVNHLCHVVENWLKQFNTSQQINFATSLTTIELKVPGSANIPHLWNSEDQETPLTVEASCGTVAKSNHLGTDPGGESIHRLIKATIFLVEFRAECAEEIDRPRPTKKTESQSPIRIPSFCPSFLQIGPHRTYT
jgi:hypothetical protein